MAIPAAIRRRRAALTGRASTCEGAGRADSPEACILEGYGGAAGQATKRHAPPAAKACEGDPRRHDVRMTTPPTASVAPRSGGWCDAHLDLAYLAALGHDLSVGLGPGHERCATLPDLAAAPVTLCFGTIYIEPGLQPDADGVVPRWGYVDRDDLEHAARAARWQLEWYLAGERAGRLRIVRWREDLEDLAANASPPRLAVVLLVEGADGIAGAADLPGWFDAGVRVLGLAWARGTRAAGGNATTEGLSDEGRELVLACDELGILHDASHLSDRAFDELLATTPRRIVATHSNARRLLGDPAAARHLADRQIEAIAARDGAIGLNLYGRFLARDRAATLADALDHVEAIASIAGRDRVGLGSDLDGGFTTADLPEGVRHPTQYASLDRGLAQRGWTEAERADFRSATWLRILRASLPSRPSAERTRPRH